MPSLNAVTDLLQNYDLKLLSHGITPQEFTNNHPWASQLLLIGSTGTKTDQDTSKFWNLFCLSEEYQDQQPDPLDRWSQRIGEHIAQKWQGKVLVPFTGPPYWPFLTWAQQVGDSSPSRLGMHLHKDYGLWHSYRFAILVPWHINTTNQPVYSAPCPSCSEPCVKACPVNAFEQEDNYAIERCRGYVKQCFTNPQNIAESLNCAQQGCLARQACPEGKGSYTLAQLHHHMKVFARH